MTKKITAVVLALVLVICCFSACAFTPDQKIIGSWQDTTGVVVLEFKEGGVCKISGNASAISPALSNISLDTEGTYTVVKDEATKEYHLNISFTVLVTVKLEYIISEVNSDILTLKSVDNGKVFSFTSYKPATNSSSSSSSAPAETTVAA